MSASCADGRRRGCEEGRAVHLSGRPEQGHDDACCASPAGIAQALRIQAQAADGTRWRNGADAAASSRMRTVQA